MASSGRNHEVVDLNEFRPNPQDKSAEDFLTVVRGLTRAFCEGHITSEEYDKSDPGNDPDNDLDKYLDYLEDPGELYWESLVATHNGIDPPEIAQMINLAEREAGLTKDS